MARKHYKAEAIILKLREAEVLLGQGAVIEEVCRKIEVNKQTYYRWRKEYGGLRIDQAQRLRELEKENGRLKKLVADLALDKQILQEASRGNW
jgi:putative transposase